jgi:tetratricopeptide (TPR) repeat protein
MLKINIFVKFALIAGGFLIGILLWALYGFGYAWIFLLLGIIMLISYLFLGTIQSATEKIQVQDFEGADKMLNLTFKPDWLYTPLRSMYYTLKGSISSYNKDNKTAEEYFQKAMSMKFNSDDEKAMVLMQMMGIQMQRQNWAGAQNYLSQLKKLNITQSIIKNQLAEVEKAFASRGNLNVARSMGKPGMQQMMQGGGGGKRRRPIGR